jgi:HSP20 family protein
MAETSVQRRPDAQREPARRGYWDPLYFSPFSMIRRLSEEMDRALSSTFGLGHTTTGEQAGTWLPAIDVRERNGNLEITAELPGMTKDDVQVESTEEGIRIQGEKKQEQTTEEGGVHRTERSYGRFYRLIPLPDGANVEKANAEFKNGVLSIRVPIDETKRKTRRLQISG